MGEETAVWQWVPATTEFAVEPAGFTVEYLKRVLPAIIFVFVLLIAGLAVYIDWTWKRQLSPRGGRYFFIALSWPFQSSNSPTKNGATTRWGVPENGTLGGQGCAVVAAAMVFKFYGSILIRSS